MKCVLSYTLGAEGGSVLCKSFQQLGREVAELALRARYSGCVLSVEVALPQASKVGVTRSLGFDGRAA